MTIGSLIKCLGWQSVGPEKSRFIEVSSDAGSRWLFDDAAELVNRRRSATDLKLYPCSALSSPGSTVPLSGSRAYNLRRLSVRSVVVALLQVDVGLR